ncbi:MAG: protein kinase [Myxococcales bacterium]|nr:protein kinase [Myxococcales bacterium]
MALSGDPFRGRIIDGRYRIDRRLGRGGFGSVYRATHLALDRPVAFKFLHDQSDGELVTRFRREARLQAMLRHPVCVIVHDFGEDDGDPWLVQELVEGRELRAVLQEAGRLPPERAVAIACRLLEGLAAAHALGIIHRDIKPANIMLVRDNGHEDVRLLDFGIARAMAEEDTCVTSPGAVIGTPRYIAPEQARGNPPEPANDLYAVGVVLYHMLAGEPPFPAPDLREAVLAHLTQDPPPLPPDVPPSLAAVVEDALAKAPEDRPPSAAAMIDRLRTALRITTGIPAPAPATSVTPHPDGMASSESGPMSSQTPGGGTAIDVGQALPSDLRRGPSTPANPRASAALIPSLAAPTNPHPTPSDARAPSAALRPSDLFTPLIGVTPSDAAAPDAAATPTPSPSASGPSGALTAPVAPSSAIPAPVPPPEGGLSPDPSSPLVGASNGNPATAQAHGDRRSSATAAPRPAHRSLALLFALCGGGTVIALGLHTGRDGERALPPIVVAAHDTADTDAALDVEASQPLDSTAPADTLVFDAIDAEPPTRPDLEADAGRRRTVPPRFDTRAARLIELDHRFRRSLDECRCSDARKALESFAVIAPLDHRQQRTAYVNRCELHVGDACSGQR